MQICKGFRGGELVVFTGPTGAGKTTLLAQLSLDFAREVRRGEGIGVKGRLLSFSHSLPTHLSITIRFSVVSLLPDCITPQGVPTLWASFEILNSKLMEKMLRQSYRKGDVSLLESKALNVVRRTKLIHCIIALPCGLTAATFFCA
jgi:ABC-type branched-subunit amino acid transport system ATPase component